MSYSLGIDLGTTHTAAAVRVGERVDIVKLGSRHAEIPSSVFVVADGDGRLHHRLTSNGGGYSHVDFARLSG